jgi:O-antigen ligase
VATTEAQKPVEAATEAPGLSAFVLALFLLFSCSSVIVTGGGARNAPYELRWVLVVSDLILGLVVLAQLAGVRALWSNRSRHRCALAAVALAVSLLPSLALHPSARGGAAVLRWIGVAMVALAVGRLAGSGRSLVLGTFTGVTVLQVTIALAERVGGGPVGLRALGESKAVEIGGRYASSGLTIHPYVLAAWCALGAAILLAAAARAGPARAGLTVAVMAPFVGVGLTMSRTGALAVTLVLASFGVAALRRPWLRVVLVAAVAATTVGVVLNLSGWMNRAAGTTASSLDSVTSNRTQLLQQAWGLYRRAPIFGVGPGRYVGALVRRPDLVKLATARPRPVHVMPYLVLVEGGLVVLPALLFLGWAVVTQSRRSGALGAGVALAVVPFLVLDHLNWSYPQGLMLTGVWLGALDQLGRPETDRDRAAPSSSSSSTTS